MKFAKIVFLSAGIYGVFVLVPMYFLESRIGRDLPPAITHPEYFYGFVGVALSFQLVFLILSSDPARYRPMMLPSILEKLTYGVAVVALLAQKRLPLPVFAVSSVDWLWAVLFVGAYVSTRGGGHGKFAA
jgi:hypothetical protein